MISNVLEEILDLLMPEGWDSLDKNSFNWNWRCQFQGLSKRKERNIYIARYILVSVWDYSARVSARSGRFERFLWFGDNRRLSRVGG